jgi:hypothetical protein
MKINRLTNLANCTRRVFTKSLKKAIFCGVFGLLKFNIESMRPIKKSSNSRNFLVKPLRALKPSAMDSSADFPFRISGFNRI